MNPFTVALNNLYEHARVEGARQERERILREVKNLMLFEFADCVEGDFVRLDEVLKIIDPDPERSQT